MIRNDDNCLPDNTDEIWESMPLDARLNEGARRLFQAIIAALVYEEPFPEAADSYFDAVQDALHQRDICIRADEKRAYFERLKAHRAALHALRMPTIH